MLPLPCMLVCVFVCANCTRDRGCSKHPVFPVCVTRRVKNYTKLGRVPPRESGPMPHAVEILNQGLALHERSHATVQCSTSSMVAGLPFWSRGCGRLPVVTCSTECSKASPHSGSG